MNLDAAATAYYEEEVTITLPRITLMSLIGACILALKHPDFPKESSAIIRLAIRNLTPLIDLYVPDDILKAWDKVLNIS